MADKTSFIKLDRNIVRWKWWTDHNTLIVFLYLILSANITDHGFCGITVYRGQLATSLPSLCNSTGLTKMQVRTALKHLKATGEITSKAYPKYQVITVLNYDKYQSSTGKTADKEQSANSHVTDKQHRLKNIETGKKGKKGEGRSAPTSPSGRKNGLPKDRDEGTAEDIPEMYRDMFTNYAAYWDWRQ